eukprot:34860_1
MINGANTICISIAITLRIQECSITAVRCLLNIISHQSCIRVRQPYVALCDKGNHCVHANRIKRCHEMKLSQREQQRLFNCDDQMDYEYILYLDKMHCALCHSNNSEKDVIRRYSKFAVYSTGVYIDHSSLSPLHAHLKDELIHNSVHWRDCLLKAQDILTSKWSEDTNKWKAKETNEIYGIRVNDPIQIEHILVIYLYTSNSTLCYCFRESYRASEYNCTRNIRSYHIDNFYWMGLFIFTAIQFFGVKPANEQEFYHGLKKQFLFTDFSTIFEPPTSTTTDRNVAQTKFAGDNGIVLTLKPKFKNDLNNSKYLDGKQEKERLFAGMTVLAVVDIQYSHQGKPISIEDYVLSFLYFERIIEQSIHNKRDYNYGVNIKKKQQRKYLFPMIRHQMTRNGYDARHEENISKDDHEYLYALFEHFCDSKQEYINLTCINDEVEQMDECIQRILFKVNDENVIIKWEINDANLQLIFPNIKGYKNYLRYWVHFDT